MADEEDGAVTDLTREEIERILEDVGCSMWRVMAALAESVDDASREELQDALGVTPEAMSELAEDTRSLLAGAVRKGAEDG